MKELFPMKQINGFVFSLLLTVAALSVYFFDMSYQLGMTVLLVTAFVQAGVQFVIFMHAGESKEKGTIYSTLFYGVFLALAAILGSLLTLVWDMM
ncbi:MULTISPECIES: cytochrome aa3 quinol oxidase subunit IV [Oceanobacillus]|uniref:Quinol oxidase subunit 4 n=1 Tax=Oceanobacillus kimchii TaxID=746691 RepID=A0ABQ5TQ53_9BACI|nr:cytochrome aa3 quinol oxidase subunit IV [Oceanobacillus kimchii]GLO68332.1 hypothetical protein MACH08_41160 [Oceanobacillus kimchii]